MRGFYPVEANQVILFEELLFVDLFESCRQNLLGENFLPGPDVVQDPCRALPLETAKIDQDYLSARPQRPVDRGQRLAGNSK